MKEKVVLGMSGGVDSSAAAWLLKEAGYDVESVTMRFYSAPGTENQANQDAEDAASVCRILSIPHRVLDLREDFRREIINPFCQSYLKGCTPNPCVLCNRRMKWAALEDIARETGAAYIATGHYAGILRLPNGRYTVQRALYDTKDQTYVLCQLTQETLSRILLPLYPYDKPAIRRMAAQLGLPVAEKKDSQDICFIPDGDHLSFIRQYYPDPSVPGLEPGNFVDTAGQVLGRHEGLARYTIGQRKGLGLAMGHPIFVTALRPDANEVVIGENEDLFTSTLMAGQVNLMGLSEEELRQGSIRGIGKIRYAHKGTPCSVTFIAPDLIRADFDEPVRAVTPGQSFVLYEGDHILLGAVICE